jgi:hypothetical protein
VCRLSASGVWNIFQKPHTPLIGVWHHGLSSSFRHFVPRPSGRGSILPCCLEHSVVQACGLGYRTRGEYPHPTRRLSLPQPCGRFAQHRCPLSERAASDFGVAHTWFCSLKRIGGKNTANPPFPSVRADGCTSRTAPPGSSLRSSLHVHRYASHHAKETAHCAPLRDAERTPPASGRPMAQPSPLPNPTPHPRVQAPRTHPPRGLVQQGVSNMG